MEVKSRELEYVSNDNITTALIPYQDVSIYKNKIKWKFEKSVKRTMDIFGGICGVLILIPLTVIIYFLNFITGNKGSLFYSQERIGKNGKRFKMYKFRSMVIDADKKLEEYLAQNEEAMAEWKKNRKLKNDPRITKIGKILRKTSLDEFPQFINVLKGDMSLVGPRAVVDGEIERFGIFQKKILSVKPGVTGNWAANGRSSTGYGERIILEAEYIDRFSILFDIKILLKTVVSVIGQKGAV